MRVHELFFPLLLTHLSGCGLILDFDPPDPTAASLEDAAGGRDASLPADASGDDAGQAELDAGSDAGFDAHMGDLDAAPEDAGSDAGPPDGGPPDAGPSPIGCADDSIEQPYPRGDIVGCDGAVTQCDAHLLCAVGWHLCGYGEYVDRGGVAVVPTATRWIASCVRTPGPACTIEAAPTNATCGGDCGRTPSTSVMVGRRCDMSGPLTDTDCPLGVVAFGEGPTVSLLSDSTCLHANVSSVSGLFGATCCR